MPPRLFVEAPREQRLHDPSRRLGAGAAAAILASQLAAEEESAVHGHTALLLRDHNPDMSTQT